MSLVIGGGDNGIALAATSSYTVNKNLKISASIATPVVGTQLSTSNVFTVPAGVNYISINAVYYTDEASAASISYFTRASIFKSLNLSRLAKVHYGSNCNCDCVTYQSGAVTLRVKVAPSTKYTLGTNVGKTSTTITTGIYHAGACIYTTTGGLGEVPSNHDTTHYAVYVDSGTGTPFTDSTTRTSYKTISGKDIPA